MFRAAVDEVVVGVTMEVTEMEKPGRGQLHRRITGAVLGAIGLILGIFAITRYTSPVSEMFSWEAPFSRYELTTIISAIIGVIFLIMGLLIFAVSFIKKRETREIPE